MAAAEDRNGGAPVLVLAPEGRDARVIQTILRETGIESDVVESVGHLVSALADGNACATVLAEEALQRPDQHDLAIWVARQPPWSDFPFVLLTFRSVPGTQHTDELIDLLGNVTVLERPLRPVTLVSAVRSALRARRRQREAEAFLEERQRTAEQLRRLNESLEARVEERTAELAAANRQLVAQIEERERVETALGQAQRLEAVGQLTAGVAHDFNNLLTVILGNIDLLARATTDPQLQQRLSFMRNAAARGAKLTGQLLAFSRRQRLEPKPIDLNEVVSSMGDLLASTMGGTVRLETVLRPGLWPALVDPTQIELVILNLVINARDAMEVGGNLTVETANVTLGPPARAEEPAAGEYVVVSVTDTGTGMSDEVRAKAFEPFFTTKEPGKGSGLGLAQVYGFAKQSGGGVRIETRMGEGTTVHVYLPRAEQFAGTDRSALPPAPQRSRGSALILVVDDDSAVREITATMLRNLGYMVLEAGSGGAALDLVEREERIDLMLVDFAMPGMNGAEVAREVRSRRPRLPILFVTGYADTQELAEAGDDRVIQKPFRDDELALKVQRALGATNSSKVLPLRQKAAP